MSKDQGDVSHIDEGEISEPIAYCVDLDEDALIKASKILGLDPTDVNFLDTPLYTHPMRDDEDDDIFRKEQVEKFYAEARPLREKYKLCELTDEEIIDAWKMFPNWGHEQHILMFGRELLKKASEK
jgi:hypothetical protein